ncbi:MAG: ROK family protein [Candidatus Omnitrophica bacterium]|nr:ROK family protein [Candidatus Omnitrophota bacterium]
MKELNFKGENLTERSRKNLFILDAIRRRGPISKTDISSLIGLNVVTVSNYVDDFLRQKIVFEKEFDISKGGRRPLLLDLNASSGYTMGIGVNLLNTIGVVTDLSGRVVHKIKKDKTSRHVKEVVDSIIGIAGELMELAKNERSRIRGIGIGIGGVVDSRREKVRWPERVGDSYHYVDVTVPLKDILEREFHYPVMIENDATVACFGEQWLALESDVKDLIYMFSGVGCGLMLNNEIYRGSSGCAGEIAIHSDRRQTPYFLERWEADCGIREEYLKLSKWKKNAPGQKQAAGEPGEITLGTIFESAKKNESPAIDIVRKAGERLGIRTAYLVNLLNPQMVIIGGGIEQAGIALIEEIREAVGEWCFQEAANAVKIVPSRLGEDAVALGAASLIIRNAFAEVGE